MNQRLLYGKCFSNGNCERFCNNFRRSVVANDPPDSCAFCLDDVSLHEIAGAIDREGNITFNRVTVPTPAPAIPILSNRERQNSFNRSGVYVPHSAGIQTSFMINIHAPFFMHGLTLFFYYLIGKRVSDGNNSYPKKSRGSMSSVLLTSSSSTSSSSSLASTLKSVVVKPKTVTVMFANVTDDTQFPFSHSDEDIMVKDGNLKYDIDFENMDAADFKMLLKSSFSYNESFLDNWYLYILVRKHTRQVKPTLYHKNKYPDVNSRKILCKDKYLVVSPVVRDENDMKTHFNRNVIDGVIILDDSSDDSSPIVSRNLIYDDDDDDVKDYDRLDEISHRYEDVPLRKIRNLSHAHEEELPHTPTDGEFAHDRSLPGSSVKR
jgi:hypothetical protein